LILIVDSSQQPRVITNSKGRKRRPGSKTLSGVVRCTDMAFLDFLEKCLTWDPKERLNPHEALQHPFMTNQRFIPRSVEISKSKLKKEETSQDLKPSLVRNKYASVAFIDDRSLRKPPGPPPKRDVLKTRGSLGSINSRLPSVTSITRLGSQISNAMGLSRNRAHNPSASKQRDGSTVLPPISYNSVYLEQSSSKPKDGFVARLNKVYFIN
jgi:dual specificity tyrosine-phosphorylation-regulated kinase 2/3/4